MSIEFFVSTDEEVENTNDFDDFVELGCQYNIIASGANDFKTVRDIYNFFIQNEDFVPNQIIKTLNCLYSGEKFRLNIYKFDKRFTELVAKIEHSQLDTTETIEYWHTRNYYSMGTWNAFFGLHNLCKFAVRDNKDVFIYEEINESKLER
jgi:hypothetical protein